MCVCACMRACVRVRVYEPTSVRMKYFSSKNLKGLQNDRDSIMKSACRYSWVYSVNLIPMNKTKTLSS